MTSTEDLLKEIQQLRAELRQMQSIVNSLVNIVIDLGELEGDVELIVPDQDNYPMYN